jgi:hypothetical protein
MIFRYEKALGQCMTRDNIAMPRVLNIPVVAFLALEYVL